MKVKRLLGLALSISVILGSVNTVSAAEAVGTNQGVVVEDGDVSPVASDSTVSVTDASGAVVFNVTVDKSAARDGLQDAFDYINANADATNIMTVKLSKGTYIIEQTLDIYSNTVLDLSNGVTLKRGCNSAMIRFGRSNEVSTGYNGYQNITITGSKNSYGVLDGGAGTKSILRFAHAQNIRLQYLNFTNIVSAHHIEFAGSRGVTIDNCKFDGFKLKKGGSTATNYEAVQLDILQESHFPNYESYDNTVNKDITITNNVFSGLNRGVGSHSAEIGRYFSNITINNNTFENITGYAVVATNFVNSKINNNKITKCGSGIFVRHMIPGYLNYYKGNTSGITTNAKIEIAHNNISVSDTSYDSSRYGVRVYGEKLKANKTISYKDEDTNQTEKITIPKGDYRLKNITVKDNAITAATVCNGIWFDGVYSSIISDNDIIYKTSKAQSASKECDGIKLELSTGNTVTKNSISDTSGSKAFVRNGIYVKDKSSGNTVTANSVKVMQDNGIYIYDSEGCNVARNTISNAKKNGIYVNVGLKATNVLKNTITDVVKHGIYINNATAGNINENVIKKANKSTSSVRGICINGSSASVKTVASNKISNCSEHGIMVNSSAKAKTITKNIITTVKRNGIYSNQNAKVSVISKNKVTSAKNVGIAVYSAKTKVTVSNNTLKKCAVYGIDLCKGVKGTVENNSITGSKKAQTRIQGVPNRSVNATELKITGISVSKGALTVKWKKISNADSYYLYRSTAKTGKYKCVAKISGTKYKDSTVTKGKTYYYKVIPVTKRGGLTVKGAATEIKSKKAVK